jgi:RND family efflux transporter MFP subunit
MKIVLPILILIVAGGILALQLAMKPEPDTVVAERPITSVEIITVQPQIVQLVVHSQGTLLPTIETDLIAEVSGRVIEVADHFRVGNRFRKGDVLLKIDPADYEAAAAAREAELANTELALAQEKALAEQAAADWEALGDGEASPLTLRTPQLKQANALVASARANLNKAQRDLERTAITVPYNGVVLSKQVDLGQFVTANPGNPLGRIYATDSAEIRLPVTEQEAAFLDTQSKRQRIVTLKQRIDQRDVTWEAPLVRIEDNINPTSRLLHVVARIQQPFEVGANKHALRRGSFLKAEIEGRTVQDAYALPRFALRGSNTLYVLTEEDTLETRTVEIIKSDAQQVIIRSGLNPGDRVAISPIAYYIEGMPVEIIETGNPGLTTEATDPGLTTEATDPGLTTEATDPGLTTKATDPGLTTKATDPGLTTKATDPGLTTKATDPGLTTEATGLPTETTVTR